MKNLLNFFFSFDKLFKEKLIVPFFWLALIVWALAYSAEALDTIALDPLARLIEFVGFFAEVLLVLVTIRIVSEIFVAIFRINDNLSPDGGKAELADIDPIGEARKAAEHATARTREITKTATDKTRLVTHTKAPSMTPKEKTEAVIGKGSVPKASDKPTPVKILEPSAIDAAAVKRGRGRPKGSKNKPKAKADTASAASASTPVKRGRGRPKGSTNKPKTEAKAADGKAPVKRGRGRPKGSKNKTTADAATATAPVKRGRGRPKGSKNKSTTGVKPGPKKGKPIPRDADGNLLKKDGTPRKKPGPKSK